MRLVVQRVSEARVEVGDQTVGQIGPGLLVLVGIRTGDTEDQARWLADKCVNLRIFEDAQGKFNRSALDITAEILVISQFTLYGDTRKGRRPSFVKAAIPEIAEPLYEKFVSYVAASGLRTQTGIFGAMMNVHLVNNGPVTILAERD